MIFYKETFSAEIKHIDSSFSKLDYNCHSNQEREIDTSMKREKSLLPTRVNPLGISVSLTDKGKNCKRLLHRHMIFYGETFSSEIKNIDSRFSKRVYNFHSAYQEREIEPSMQ